MEWSNALYIGGYANETSCYVPAKTFLPPLGAVLGKLRGRSGSTDYPGHRRWQYDDLPADRAFPRWGSSGVHEPFITP